MNRHERVQGMLLFPEEMTPEERLQAEEHMRTCQQCKEAVGMIGANTTALGGISRVPAPGIATDAIKTAARPAMHSRKTRWVGLAVAAITATGAAVLGAFLLLGGRTATPVSAYALLQRAVQADSSVYPYSGTASSSYAQIPWYLLPPEVADYAGRHRITTRWWVRDAHHFRVQIQVLGPPLERGSVTAVLNGSVLTMYDARTRHATVIQGATYRALGLLPALLLNLLQTGSALGGIYDTQAPNPTASISAYLASLRAVRAEQGVHPYARIVGSTHLLGRAVDVVDYGPLSVLSYDSSGCHPTAVAAPGQKPVTHPAAGPCIHYRQPVGWARVWITQDHPFILRFEQHGLSHVHNVLESSIRFRYRVTSLRTGSGPQAAALAYRPPVAPTVRTVNRFQAPEVGTLQSNQDATAAGFLPASLPSALALNGYARLATTVYGGEVYAPKNIGPPPFPYIPGMDVLFSHVRKWVKVYTKWHGQASIYVTGPYILVQERKLAAGLPVEFSRGATAAAGTCQVRTGRYWDGQRWLAFERGSVSVVISSNSLSADGLSKYAAGTLCQR